MSVLLVEHDGAVAIVTMNRPEAMNALSRALRKELAETFDRLDADQKVRTIVLTGSGERAFCAGLDLRELGADVAALNAENGSSNALRAMERCSKPIIGAINGAAITGGFELALACDILIASDKARFADTHGRVGVMPGWGLSQRLPRLIGMSRAKEISLSGNFVGAEQALAWGIVNHVVSAAELMSRAKALAADIAQVDDVFVRAQKALMDDGYGLPFAEAIELERERSQLFNAGVRPEEVEARRAAVQLRGRMQA